MLKERRQVGPLARADEPALARRVARRRDRPVDTANVFPTECILTVWRSLALAGALHLALGSAAASAQTLYVVNAPPGSMAEFVLNGAAAATGTANAEGVATLPARTGNLDAQQSIDAFVWLDVCGTTYRVVVGDRAVQPPAADGGCRRSQIPGLFLLRSITSLVVDAGASSPTLRIRQGQVPDAWLRPLVQEANGPRISIAPTGVILFGGAGRASFSEFSNRACGDVTGCDISDTPLSYAGGISYWFSQYVGAEASFVRPGRITASGSGTRYRFDSDMDGGLVSVVGKGGVPIGRVRLYGLGGANRHRATFTTSQTIDAATVTIDGVSETIPGGTPRYQWRTEGWGLVVGGGGEVWLTGRFGLYGEFSRVALKGDDVSNSEATTDDVITSIVVGARFRIR